MYIYFPLVAIFTTLAAAIPAPEAYKRQPLDKIDIGTIIHGLSANTLASTSTPVEYETCPSVGSIHQITVEPCQGGQGTIESPCEFTAGSNYTITITFDTPTSSTTPRSNLAYHDPNPTEPRYATGPYPGQAFDACRWYLNCPVPANTVQKYTYELKTTDKPNFDKLTYNVTDGLSGPSLFCASLPVKFIPVA